MAKKEPQKAGIVGIDELAQLIGEVNQHFLSVVQRQVNTALTLRNWIIGYYIVEFEQKGKDRAAVYGERLFKSIADHLKGKGVTSIRERHLYLCKDFYLAYPQILRTPSAESLLKGFREKDILRTVSAKSEKEGIEPETLITVLSFSHFIELLKADTPLKRQFYESQALKNHWSVRELKRAMDSLLFERTGLSKRKDEALKKYQKELDLQPEDIFRNPYILEFLNLEERPSYSENDLEQAIINHLQSFLLEMGRGFCFEARQKRITFDNTHYRIDLIFYHRILKCHVLVDLKIGEFSHADAGQMNMYLNYYKENER